MQEIIDYTILGSRTAFGLKGDVVEYINNGWQPIGNVVIDINRDANRDQYYQTMVRYKVDVTPIGNKHGNIVPF